MFGFRPGDVFAAYLKRHGYVGIGRIVTDAKMVRDVRVGKRSLLDLPLSADLSEHADDPDNTEYACLVEWLKAVPRGEAKWRSMPKLYTTTHIRASLDGQASTVAFLEEAFGVTVRELVA